MELTELGRFRGEKKSECRLGDKKLLNRTALSGDKWCPGPVECQEWPLNQSEVSVQAESRLPPPRVAAI